MKRYELAIQAYNRAIDLDPRFAAAFNNRGNAFRLLENYDRAIQDFDKAIGLNPKYALAFSNRGHAFNGTQQYERGLADFETALGLVSSSANQLRMGRQLFFLGRFVESAEISARAVQSSPESKYAILWLYLAQAKSAGLPTASETLTANAAKIVDQKWPSPVIEFYRGKIDQKLLYAAADDPDPQRKAEQVCEANFYIAEVKMLDGATGDAIPLLKAAVQDCPRTFNEFHGARTELKRLGV
jgi:lipoprotein NlpI